jgi:hypothetical protein
MIYYLHAFDPSTKATGYALFEDGRLTFAYVIEAKGVDSMIENVQTFLKWSWAKGFAVLETPRTYPRSPAKTKSLLMITQIVGAIRAHFPTSRTYTPQQWNHGRPKKVTRERINDLLSPSELAMMLAIRKGIRGDAYDAVGVGMHHLGRLK